MSGGGSNDQGGWRHASRPTRGTGHWKRRQKEPAINNALARRLKLLFLTLASFGLLAIFVWRILVAPLATTILVLDLSQLPDPLPVNGLVQHDLKRMKDAFDDSRNIRWIPVELKSGEAQDIRTTFSRTVENTIVKGPNYYERTLIVYIVGSGIVNGKGEACLLTPKSKLWDESTWLPVQELLTDLKNSPYLSKRKARRVVLVDAGRNESNWSMGHLYNGFADSLKRDVEDHVQDPNLYVINSARQNDISWTAPEMGGTPFGYFVAEAFNGGGSAGGRITLREFVDYVTQHVDGFAANYRGGVRQQPELITVGDTTRKIGLTYAAGVTIEPPVARVATEMQVRLAKLNELTLGAAAAQDQHHAYAYEPESFSRLQHLLTRLERLAVAGEAYDEQYSDAYLEAEALIGELPHVRGRFAARQNFAPSLAFADELAPVSDALRTDYAQRWKAWLTKPEAERAMEELPTAEYPVVAEVIWDWLIGPENGIVTRERLAMAVSALQASAGDSNRLEYSEVQAMRLLLRDVDWTRVSDEVGLTLRLLRDAEMTAAMPDLRAHYWLRPRLAGLDRSLRAARDQLLVGSSKSLERCRQLSVGLAGQQQGYATARSERDAFISAIRLRDRAFALLPYHANWIANHPTLEQRKELLQQCVDGIGVAHQLGSRLDQTPSDDWDQQWLEIQGDLQRLDQTLTSLSQFYRATCDRLNTDKMDPSQSDLNEIESVLQVPLVASSSPGLRNELRETLWRNRWHAMGEAGFELVKKPLVAEAAKNIGRELDDTLICTSDLEQHPALALFTHPDVEPEDGEDLKGPVVIPENATPDQVHVARCQLLDRYGAILRRRLTAVADDAQRLARETDAKLESSTVAAADGKWGELETPSTVRRGLSRAERLVRASSPLILERPGELLSTKYLKNLRSLDQQFYTLWFGERAEADMWAGLRESESPYFARMTDALRGLAYSLGSDTKAYQSMLKRRVDERAAAVSQWKDVSTRELRIQEDPYLRQVFTYRTLDVPAGQSWGDLQGAVASIFVEDSAQSRIAWYAERGGNAEDARIAASVLPEGTSSEQTFERWIKNSVLLSSVDSLQAVRLFRGHRSVNPFEVQQGSGSSIAFTRPPEQPTTVLVRGDGRDKMRTLFVLDCSHSMKEQVSPGKNRMDVASAILLEALSGMDDLTDEVGLMLFAHRCQQNKEGVNRPHICEPSFNPDQPNATHTMNDVEMVIPMGGFMRPNREAGGLPEPVFEKFREMLDRAIEVNHPLNTTPLYHAIDVATTALTASGATGIGQVIVITDGVDNPTDVADRRIASYTSLAELDRRVSGRNNVYLHVIGFGIPSSEPANRAKYQELKEFLNSSKHPRRSLAEFQSTESSARNLLLEIQKHVAPPKYSVWQGDRELSNPVSVGREWTQHEKLPVGPPGTKLTVKLVDRQVSPASVITEGGESFLLILNRNGGLQHKRYDNNDVSDFVRASVPGATDETGGFQLALHREHPRSYDGRGGYTFWVSVQNADEKRFSPRPRWAFAEIRPVKVEGPHPTSVFYGYDSYFEPGTPVPVLRYEVSGWPSDYKEFAQLKLRFSFDADQDGFPPGAVRIPLSWEEPVESDEVPGVQFEVIPSTETAGTNACRLVVNETHDALSTFPVWLTCDPPADSIRHEFNLTDRSITHVYGYNSRPPYAPKLIVVTQETMNKTWATHTDPLQMELPNR